MTINKLPRGQIIVCKYILFYLRINILGKSAKVSSYNQRVFLQVEKKYMRLN